jgi:hypothetical protein
MESNIWITPAASTRHRFERTRNRRGRTSAMRRAKPNSPPDQGGRQVGAVVRRVERDQPQRHGDRSEILVEGAPIVAEKLAVLSPQPIHHPPRESRLASQRVEVVWLQAAASSDSIGPREFAIH